MIQSHLQAARLATPSERLALWTAHSSPPDYLTEVLPNFERLSREVQGSTFHIHGSVEPEKITKDYIRAYAANLREHFTATDLLPSEQKSIFDRIAIAHSDLSHYVAYKTLTTMKNSASPLWASDIEEMAKDATELFMTARDRSDMSEEQKQTLAKSHEKLIAAAKRKASISSLSQDLISIKTKGAALDPCQRDNLVRRSGGNIDVLKTGETTQKARQNLENIRSDINFAYLLSQLPGYRHKAEKTLIF
jgi:hypothetical protein